MGNGNQGREEVIVGETRSIVIENEQEHDRHEIHHVLHSWHLILSCVGVLHVDVGVDKVRYRHQETEQRKMVAEVFGDERYLRIPFHDGIVGGEVLCPEEGLLTQFDGCREEHEHSEKYRHL